MRLEWFPETVRNRETQLAHIGARAPAATISMGDAIETIVDRLADVPESAPPDLTRKGVAGKPTKVSRP